MGLQTPAWMIAFRIMIPADFEYSISRRALFAASWLLLLPVCARADTPSWRGLAELEKLSGARVGVAAIDSSNGSILAWRETERFVMCSSFKLSLAAATLARADQGAEKLERLVRYDKSVPFGVSPATAKNVDHGMTVAELCEAAIIFSDNGAANLLLAAMGGPSALTAFWRQLGDQSTRLDDNEPKLNIPDGERNTTTPIAMMADMNTYLLGDALSAASRARLLGWMRGNTTGAARLRAGVPADWQVGDKTGTSPSPYGLVSDIGILMPPGRKPILAAIYSEHGSDQVIASAAAVVAAAFA
jgi:beta-lactamase class A